MYVVLFCYKFEGSYIVAVTSSSIEASAIKSDIMKLKDFDTEVEYVKIKKYKDGYMIEHLKEALGFIIK